MWLWGWGRFLKNVGERIRLRISEMVRAQPQEPAIIDDVGVESAVARLGWLVFAALGVEVFDEIFQDVERCDIEQLRPVTLFG